MVDDLVPDPTAPAAPTPQPVLTRADLGALVGAAAAAGALDGLIGCISVVTIAVVLLARLPRRLIGLIGVASLAGVPVAVVVQGVPDDASVSPAFVSASMWPHHLAFIGMFLVGVGAVLDVAPQLRSRDGAGEPAGEVRDPLESWPLLARVAVVVSVALCALAAAILVLQA